MSKDKDKDKKDGADGEEDGPPSPSKLPMLLALVNILATGAVGFLSLIHI